MSDGGGSNMMSSSRSSSAPASGDEDEAAAHEAPDLEWEDDGLRAHLLTSLNQMRKDKHFCDVILQVMILRACLHCDVGHLTV